MTILLLTACAGLIIGAFFIFRISPMDFTAGIFQRLTDAPKSVRDDIDEATQRKKPGFFRREIQNAQAILAATGKAERFPAVCALSLLLFAVGAAISIAIENLFLIPVLALGLMLVPFWYIRLTAGGFKKHVSAELETALSIITSAYLRSGDIVKAVRENLGYLNPPVHRVFQTFLFRLEYVNPDVNDAIAVMRAAIDNEVFREWCDALAACQDDLSLKATLRPIVSKLSDMRVVNAELQTLVFGPRKEFITMAALVLCNIPLLYFLNKDWYHTLMHTLPGQAVLALCAAAIFVSFALVIKLTQPIEYKR